MQKRGGVLLLLMLFVLLLLLLPLLPSMLPQSLLLLLLVLLRPIPVLLLLLLLIRRRTRVSKFVCLSPLLCLSPTLVPYGAACLSLALVAAFLCLFVSLSPSLMSLSVSVPGVVSFWCLPGYLLSASLSPRPCA